MFWRKEQPEMPEIEFMLVLKEDALNTIKRAKGWKSDAELARNLNFTRQYICSLKKRKTPVTHEVIIRISGCLGNTNGNWHHHFEIIKVGPYNPDHMKYNQAKHDGKQPYSKYSVMADMRSQDSLVEKRER